MADSERALIAPDGVEVTYWVSRRSERADRALLLLHGAASNHTRWSELVEETRLTGSWTVVRPDLRGNGASMTRARQGLGVWCDDLVRILDAEHVARAVVIGHSLGAQIAVYLRYRTPDRVRGLVLIDPVFRAALRGKHGAYSRHPGLLLAAANLVLVLNRLGLRRREIPDRDLRELDEETRQAMSAGESFEVIAKRYGALGPVLRHMPVANYLRQMVATFAALPPLEEVDVPVLVLLSGGITFADLETNRRELARFPDAEVVTLDANHWPLTETPEAVREAIEEWIERRFPE